MQRRKFWMKTHLALETQDGHSPTIPYNTFMPPIELLFVIPWMAPGQIYVFFTPVLVPAGALIAYSLRRVPAPGQPANKNFSQIKITTNRADAGSFVISNLIPGALYSLSVSVAPPTPWYLGPSSTWREVYAKA